MWKTCRPATGESSSCSTLTICLDAGLTLRLNIIAGDSSSLSLSPYMLGCFKKRGKVLLLFRTSSCSSASQMGFMHHWMNQLVETTRL
jgi:hypothetical protein